MAAAIVGFDAQVLGPRCRPILSPSHPSPSLLPFPRPRRTSFSLLHHSRHPLPLLGFPVTGGRLSRLGTSLRTEDPALDEDEVVADGGWSRGSDWGQQDEASEEEGEGKVVDFGAGGGVEGFSVPPAGTRIFVGNLPYDVGSEGLAGVFLEAGEVEEAEVIYNRETDRSRGFGFVTMRTIEEAEKAIDMFNNYDLNGRLLQVNKASRRGSQPIRASRVANRSIYVGNLPWAVNDARLVQVFGEHGKVVDARVLYDRETGRSRGIGFVKMSTNEEMDHAIASLDGQDLDGRPIRVSVAEERPRRS